MQKNLRIGIMGAMTEEVDALRQSFEDVTSVTSASREYVIGTLHGLPTVLVFSRWGKVAAAITAATLIHKYQVDCIIFTGAAGAIASDLNVGDIVIADTLYQHDMDASPLFEKYEIPLTGETFLPCAPWLVENAQQASEKFLPRIPDLITPMDRRAFALQTPKVMRGLIATGDQFIHLPQQFAQLKTHMPHVLAVEMEGAAVAQVCREHGIPFVIIRTISDKADQAAPTDFPAFIEKIMRPYSAGIILEMYRQGFVSEVR